MSNLYVAAGVAAAAGLLYLRSRLPSGLHKFYYFGIFGKGPAPALALAHSGLEFEVIFPDDWQAMKPTTPWGHLPVLEVPNGDKIGHEFAILVHWQYLFQDGRCNDA